MGCASSNAGRVDEEEKKEVDPKDDGAGHHVHSVESHGRIINIEAGLGTGVAVDCEAAMKMLYRRNPRWRLALRFLKRGWKRLDSNDTWLPGTEDNDNNGQEGCRAGDLENADICSVNSSFRFSFGSQVDWEACSPGGATVLLVNLEKEMENNREGNDLGPKSQFEWARIQSLERQVLPAVEGLVRFQYDEIRAATADFSQDRVLGRGAHSCVYRGKLRHGKLVAVKRLDKNDKEAGKDFCRELHIASGLKNRYVVPLVGFCIDILGVFLVYKFVSGGSLEYYLHDKKGKGCLSWSSRLKVAMGIAKAVDYLHHGTEKCVVHRDIKPSNILLSSSKTAMLCDFGLATWTVGASVPFLCKTVKGTFGYLAPEYFQHGKVSEKTDIYAFGVVLLELLTGRKPIETKRPSGDENLVIWARPLLYEGMTEELADPRLRSSYRWKRKEVDRMMRAALVCLHPMESWRPCMNQVLRILNGKEDAKLLNRARLTMLNVNTDYFAENVNGREGMKALKSHMALAMVGVDGDADEEKPDYKLDR